MPLMTFCKGVYCPSKEKCLRYINHKNKIYAGAYQNFYKLMNWGEDSCKFFVKKD